MASKKTFRQNSAITANLLYSSEPDSLFFDKISSMMRGYGDSENPFKVIIQVPQFLCGL